MTPEEAAEVIQKGNPKQLNILEQAQKFSLHLQHIEEQLKPNQNSQTPTNH